MTNPLDTDPYYQTECDERDTIWWWQQDSLHREWMEQYCKHSEDMTMTDRSKMFESKSDYLKAEDIPEGKEFKLSISHTTVAQVKDQQDGTTKDKLIVHFEGKEKGLMLNNTNFKKIAAAYGADDSNWSGKALLLYRDITEFGGKDVPCLRVRVPVQQADSGDVPF